MSVSRKSFGFAALIVCLPFAVFAQETDVMQDFVQIIPRGRIAAITEPVYVPASEADIEGESWVLGVVIDGQARAYSLKLLNRHEVVNDKIGRLDFAAVW